MSVCQVLLSNAQSCILLYYILTLLPALHAGPSQQNMLYYNAVIIYKYTEHMHVTSTVGEFVSYSVLTCTSKHYMAIVYVRGSSS